MVRSLGRAGFEPYVTSARRHSLAGASRYASDQAATANPLTDPSAFVEDLAGLIGRWNIGTLIPTSEPALLAVLGARARLDVDIPFPDLQVFRSICDKRAVLQVAPSVGLAVPRQAVVNSPEEIEQQSWTEVPVVIKPIAQCERVEWHAFEAGCELRGVTR